ncbi:MAG: hypothetical protein HC781_22980 [Leptolyngbyaceae cyanobacterium CSU_1_4]|nr:hypothetical protein [Leptolyngbyaceae cyanobacterium CSU_1_4]
MHDANASSDRKIRALRRKHGNDGYATYFTCGSTQNLTLDHVIPLSKGGSDLPGNLACACLQCNSSKSDRTVQEWKGSN